MRKNGEIQKSCQACCSVSGLLRHGFSETQENAQSLVMLDPWRTAYGVCLLRFLSSCEIGSSGSGTTLLLCLWIGYDLEMHPSHLLCLLTCCLLLPGNLSATQATEPTTDDDGIEYFETHIRPLLVKRCYACHSEQSDSKEGGLYLDTQEGWSTGGERGPALIPGDVAASLLVRAIRYDEPDLEMPPDQRLPQYAIERLEHWVRIGAPDPRDGQAGAVTSTAPHDPVAGREHWAFRSLSQLNPPEVLGKNWPRSSFDRFVLAKIEEADLQPVPDANRRTLIRRLYFQLVGLPPTVQQITRFLEDARPDAYERLVDELLSSRHFGERWGRHWLDLARYADSNGLDENFLFREAWRYRNWVIDAVNHDVPFDQFLTEQIAGDLLPFESIAQRDRQRIAAGFMVLGPKVLLGNDPQRQQMEVADEQLDTIGKAILGQTLGCARCHDHKFDPIPTADYYSMAGIMTSTQVMERRHMLGQQRVMERLVGIGADGNKLDEQYETYWREQPKRKGRLEQAKRALELLEKDDAEGLTKQIDKHPDSVADDGNNRDLAITKRIASQKSFVAELAQALKTQPAIPPRAMIPGEHDEVSDECIRIAGEFDRPGAEVPRGFLQVLTDGKAEIPSGSSGRLELARWMTDVEAGAGRLAARVLANRIWYHLLGRGIVRTVDNFGRTGEPPTHPALLDFLAQELIDSDWSVKHLVREIVLSRTFMTSSMHDDVAHSIDPDNRLLWRAHRRRLDPESLRDAMLSAAGELDLTPMESSVWYLGDQATAVGANKVRRRTDFPCRSVYLPVIRNDLPELFDVFDFADPHATTGSRPQTLVATQGLFLLNDNSVMEAADATANRILNAESAGSANARVDRMYELVLGALPSGPERKQLRQFVTAMQERFKADDKATAEQRAWSLACHALFASSRFQVLD